MTVPSDVCLDDHAVVSELGIVSDTKGMCCPWIHCELSNGFQRESKGLGRQPNGNALVASGPRTFPWSENSDDSLRHSSIVVDAPGSHG
jgi:hypothetical protein